MESDIHTPDDPLLDEKQAADILGVKTGTMEKWRCIGRPDLKFVKIGRLVRYRRSEIEAFIKRNTIDRNNAA